MKQRILKVLVSGLLLAATAGSAGAQQANRPVNQNQAAPPPGAAVLRGQIEDVYRRRVRTELGLAPDLAQRVDRVLNSWGQRRTQLERQERQLRQQLNGNLVPGVAADDSTLLRIVDAINDNRVATAESFRDEMRELAPLLTPVQRGRYQQMRDRFLQQVANVQQGVAGNGAAPRGAANPAARPLKGGGGGLRPFR